MCLSVATSRKPLFTTAYKIMRGEYRSMHDKLCAYTLYQRDELVINSEWNVNSTPDIRLSYDEYYQYDGSYQSGFHSFVKLEHAIIFLKHTRNIGRQDASLYEVDTDDIRQYGVEKHWYSKNNTHHMYHMDVVVSGKIKFNQKIEV